MTGLIFCKKSLLDSKVTTVNERKLENYQTEFDRINHALADVGIDPSIVHVFITVQLESAKGIMELYRPSKSVTLWEEIKANTAAMLKHLLDKDFDYNSYTSTPVTDILDRASFLKMQLTNAGFKIEILREFLETNLQPFEAMGHIQISINDRLVDFQIVISQISLLIYFLS